MGRLAILLLGALGVGATVTPLPGVGVRHGGSARSGVAAATAFSGTFQADYSDAATDSGCDFEGSESITINGLTESTPVFEYFGGSADATNWDAAVGTTATAEGSGGSFNQGSPLMGTADDSVNPGGTRSYDAGDVYGVGTEDIVFELVLEAGADTDADAVFDKKDGTGAGYRFQYNATGETFQFVIEDGSTNTATVASAAVKPGAHYVIHGFMDTSGSGQLYLNASTSGAAVSLATVGTLTNSSRFGLGGNDDATGVYDSRIQCLRMWTRSSWLDTHLQGTVALQRFSDIVGITADSADANAYPTTLDRASDNQWVTNWTDSTKPSQFRVGADWPIMERLRDSAGTVHIALRGTGAQSNQIITYTEGMTTGWTATRSSVSATTITAPDGSTCTDCILAEDGTAAATHLVTQNTGAIAAGRHTIGVFCQGINRDWIRLAANSGGEPNANVFANCTTCALGTEGADVVFAEARAYGDWCHVQFEYDQAAGGSNSHRVWIADADNSDSFDGLSQDSVALWGQQFYENSSWEGEWKMYIASPAATPETIQNQVIKYEGNDNVGNAGSPAEGTHNCDVRIGYDTTGAAIGAGSFASIPICPAGSSTKYIRMGIYSDNKGIWSGRQTTTFWDLTGSTALDDGLPHEMIGTFTESPSDSAKLYIDGSSEGTEDTSLTVPTGLDTVWVGDCSQSGIGSAFLGHITQCSIYETVEAP